MKKIAFVLIAGLMLQGAVLAQKYGNTPEDSVECVKNLSLYREFYKQWEQAKFTGDGIKDAIKPWKWVLLNCPEASQNTYVNGSVIMGYLIENEKDSLIKEGLIDTLCFVYDQRIKYYGTDKKYPEGFIRGRKGVDLYKTTAGRVQQTFDELKLSTSQMGDRTEGSVLTYYMLAATRMVTAKLAEVELIFDTYEIVNKIVEKRMANPKDTAQFSKVQANIEGIIDPWGKCETLIPIYQKKFDATPDDVELLKKITQKLIDKGCTQEKLYLDAAIKLYSIEPSAEAAIGIAKLHVQNEKYDDAVKMYKEAINAETDNNKKAQYCYELADLLFNKMKSNAQAKSYATQAYQLKSDFGDAIILAGDVIYSTRGCGANPIEERSVFWLAADYYARAKAADPSVAAKANERINRCAGQFPDKELAFFHNVKDGDTITVPCFGETTKARF